MWWQWGLVYDIAASFAYSSSFLSQMHTHQIYCICIYLTRVNFYGDGGLVQTSPELHLQMQRSQIFIFMRLLTNLCFLYQWPYTYIA